jgi:site-specific DNA-methyltransferase (adenine-specific)
MRQGFKPYKCKQGRMSTCYDHEHSKETITVNDGNRYPIDIIQYNKDRDTFHPTQKPVDLLRYLVLTYTNEGDTVLDNCMGSGTTAIACIKEKRHFIGFELNKEYYEKAVRRIRNEQRQLKLF